jgi:hypothetical protein
LAAPDAEAFAKELNSNLIAFRAQVPGATADAAKLVISRR